MIMKNLAWIISLMLLVGNGLRGEAGAQILTVPGSFGNVRAFPNPWRSDQNASAMMTFDGFPSSAVTTLRLFTIAGEHVRTLSGTQSIQWDLRNSSGERVASGIYIYLLTANNEQKSGKIAVIR
jgi:hypothetical protein